MKKRVKLLWLPGWYPSKQDFLAGDFIDRHAKAASEFADIIVLFVTKNFSLQKNKDYIEIEQNNGLCIYRGYYNNSTKFGYFGKLGSVFLYYKLLFKMYAIVKVKYGKFDLVHMHISLRQGLLALWLKCVYGIPYVITEHNSWFVPTGNKFYTTSIPLKLMIKFNFKNENALHVVSNTLGIELKKKFHFIKSFTVIPNVVDTNVFFYKKNTVANLEINFFTITGDVYHKNTDGTIRAFSEFIKKGHTAILHIAGPYNEELNLLVQKLCITNSVKLYGAISNSEVAKIMQEIDAFIFFTRYETFGCVMAEALCCGKPVIASKIPVLEENLTEFTNALFVIQENEDDLTQKLIFFMGNRHLFNENEISMSAMEKYNYKRIGKEFLSLYLSVLKEC